MGTIRKVARFYLGGLWFGGLPWCSSLWSALCPRGWPGSGYLHFSWVGSLALPPGRCPSPSEEPGIISSSSLLLSIPRGIPEPPRHCVVGITLPWEVKDREGKSSHMVGVPRHSWSLLFWGWAVDKKNIVRLKSNALVRSWALVDLNLDRV